jgi:hypothetical protein
MFANVAKARADAAEAQKATEQRLLMQEAAGIQADQQAETLEPMEGMTAREMAEHHTWSELTKATAQKLAGMEGGDRRARAFMDQAKMDRAQLLERRAAGQFLEGMQDRVASGAYTIDGMEGHGAGANGEQQDPIGERVRFIMEGLESGEMTMQQAYEADRAILGMVVEENTRLAQRQSAISYLDKRISAADPFSLEGQAAQQVKAEFRAGVTELDGITRRLSQVAREMEAGDYDEASRRQAFQARGAPPETPGTSPDAGQGYTWDIAPEEAPAVAAGRPANGQAGAPASWGSLSKKRQAALVARLEQAAREGTKLSELEEEFGLDFETMPRAVQAKIIAAAKK